MKNQLETYLEDIIFTAKKIDAPYNSQKIKKVLNSYDFLFNDAENSALALRTTTKEKASLSYRYVNIAAPHDPYKIALENGLLTKEQHPIYEVVPELQASGYQLGYGIDAEVNNGIEKVWVFFTEQAMPLNDVFALSSLPTSIQRYAEHFQKYHLDKVGLFAIDYQHKTINLYFMQAQPGQYPPEVVANMVSDLDFPGASSEILEFCSQTGCINYTFSWDSDKAERLCYYFPIPQHMMPVHYHPRLQLFAENAPFIVDEKMCIFGITFAPNGLYHKPESEYNGIMMNIFGQLIQNVAPAVVA